SGKRKTGGGTERCGILIGQCALCHREDPTEKDTAEKGTRAARTATAVRRDSRAKIRSVFPTENMLWISRIVAAVPFCCKKTTNSDLK
ncbi:MAG: hypothetical protein QNK16_08895, partial [Woeseiaceae bacterium]|nr:hypothetical protein [Woeseiaceae bacterium]MDX2608485.1 hypothetical protein [Woeseiaceae bacterium]